MAKRYSSQIDLFQLFSPILIILYLSIGFIPNLEAVDKIAPQWLAMSGLNLASILLIFYHKKTISKTITTSLVSGISITYIGFIFWAAFSYFYAINPTEVIVNITRQVNVLIMMLCMGILLFKMKQKPVFISWALTLILSIEVYSVLNEALNMISNTGVISPGALKGVTANRNITAFSLAIKIPFILYLILKLQKLSFKLLLGGLIFLSFVCLTMIQSRASFIAIGLIFVNYTVSNIYLYLREERKISRLLQTLYFVLPLLFALLINQTIIADKGADVISRAATISISTNDGSVNQRLRYYQDVLLHMKSNPILGTGLGNWKLKSIDYDSKDIQGYIVPYHAHSDFIQLGAELGFIGFFLYLGIFLWAGYYVYILILRSSILIEEKVFVFLLITSLGVYSIDANLNFPIARPQVLVVWSAIIAITMIYYQKYKSQTQKFKENKKLNTLFIVLAFVFIVPSLYITNSVYKSLKGQMFLLQDFNSNQYNIPLNQVDKIVPSIPNITVTTIPINSVKARYYVNAKKYDKALTLLDKGTDANPYLYYSEILKSQIFQELGKLDSAKFYAKKAFFGLPNNDLHASKYINLINITRDRDALEEAFELLTLNEKSNNWKNYLIIASGLYPKGSKFLAERAKKATELFPNNIEFISLYRQIVVGNDGFQRATINSNKGLKYFKELDYKNAAIEFEKALELNPLDYSNFENAATANYMVGNVEKALEQINIVINELNPLNGKCEYIKALIFIRMGDPIGACPLLATSRDSGHSPALGTYDQYCR
jgi:O-antigen ligase/tetratricopeptide (TPR) repeat protein